MNLQTLQNKPNPSTNLPLVQFIILFSPADMHVTKSVPVKRNEDVNPVFFNHSAN